MEAPRRAAPDPMEEQHPIAEVAPPGVSASRSQTEPAPLEAGYDATYDAYDAPADDSDYDEERPSGPRHHPFRAIVTLIVALAVVVGGGYLVYSKGLDWVRSLNHQAADYPGPGVTDVIVTIPRGASSSAMATILRTQDVIASPEAFTAAVRSDPVTFQAIQAGDHRLKTQMSAVQALTALADPTKVVQLQFTIADGLDAATILGRIATQTSVSVPDLQSALANPAGLGLPDWAEVNAPNQDANAVQGYLYPETYAYTPTSTAQTMLSSAVAQFTSVTNGLDFAAKAKAHNLTPAQAVVLASIIEKEGADPRYAKDIAQVFYNRLAIGMTLGSDATVLYANHVSGTFQVTSDMKAVDSPYNTFKYAGLPPGPICNPGKVALEAAVNPTEGTYLYFVAVNPSTGEVKFASDAAGHQANTEEFQAWCDANPGQC